MTSVEVIELSQIAAFEFVEAAPEELEVLELCLAFDRRYYRCIYCFIRISELSCYTCYLNSEGKEGALNW